MDEYKGIYYGDDSEKKFFEGGAHFKYSKLYKRLEQIALERKEKEKEKEKDLYIHKKKNLINLLNNNNIHNFDNSTKEKKSRNIQSCFNNNLTNSSMTNNTKNKTFNNIVFFKYNQKKANNNNNDSLMNNKTNYYQTYIIVKNKGKDNLNQKPKIIDIKKKKKMNISRNKISSVIFKARPNTILKDGMKNILLFGKNNLIFKSMEQETKNKKVPIENLNKRSFPNLNNMINMNKFKKVKTNASFLEFNKIRVKTERNKNVGIAEKWNKSQNNFNLIKIRLKSISSKNDGNKIKKKNYIVNDNKKIKETSKSKLTNYIYKNIMEQFNLKTGKEGEEKKESIIKKSNKNLNVSNPNKIIVFHTNRNKSNINLNSQIKKIMYKPNISQKIDKKIINNLNKISFNGKTKKINVCFNEINNSYDMKIKKNLKSRNNLIMNTSRSISKEKFKTSIKMKIGKMPNMKLNNKIIQHKNKISKFTPINNKKINKNPSTGNKNNLNENIKKVNYEFVLNSFPIDKKKILNNINANNNLSKMNNKPLSINIINNTCIYIKPKQLKYGIKKQSRNERTQSDMMPINYTQRTIIRKKKPILKFAK